MTPTPISLHLEARSVVPMESTIPVGMTVEQWRRRSSRPRRARHLVAVPPAPCDHLQDTTSRYDPVAKQMSFLMVCSVCGTEKLIDTVDYEPRFQPRPTDEPAGATVHQLTPRRRRLPIRRAA